MSIFGLSCITHICYMQLHKRTPADVPVSEVFIFQSSSVFNLSWFEVWLNRGAVMLSTDSELVYFFINMSESLRFGT